VAGTGEGQRDGPAKTALIVGAVVVALGAAFGIGVLVGDNGDESGESTVPEGSEPAVLRTPTPSLIAGVAMEQVPTDDPVKGTRTGSPLDDLPPGVRQLTDFGQRPGWSPDGKTIVFLDGSPIGNVWTVDVRSGKSRELTKDFAPRGFSRAYYLSNGDLLLCGPTSGPKPSAARPEDGRFTGVMSVFRAPFDAPPEALGVPCWEGMATSGTSMQIAWNRSDIDYTDPNLVNRVVNGITEIWTGEIGEVDGRATIVNPRKVVDRDTVGVFGVLEVQDFRPPNDRELIFTVYAYQGGEVFGLDLKTGAVRNYSNSSAYEEVEGITPDGTAVYLERDLEYTGIDPSALDIWRLGLEDAKWERITEFNRWAPFYASNPSVSSDGKQLAFQLSIDGETEGQGAGILLMPLSGT
jgi:hypothetical protein